ncbi:hypothetical protein L1987_64654 [Smallanthus sonchifolius]|uniref:Uncharacterized protein n=1 Tax=Smallanthus sonchifolius TaxID=185202 RepID=A0ACB9BS98_9ASTR|nr:hypothetical protein L1987_64654 [Smallanthus sonchifolius]
MKTSRFLLILHDLYKFLVNRDWRHSTSSPIERDDRGNLNSILEVGGIANVRHFYSTTEKGDESSTSLVIRG